MRKLFLASFKFTTGTTEEYAEQRIIAVNSVKNNDKTEEQWLKEAYELAMGWFPNNYKESALISCIVHPTITDTSTHIG